MNELEKINRKRRQEFEAFRDAKVRRHRAQAAPNFDDYPLPKLQHRITAALSARWGRGPLQPNFELIERQKFGGDISVKFPQLLADGGPKAFIQKHVPWIVEVLSSAEFKDAIAKIDVKGMYINLTISNRWLLDSAQAIADHGAEFGHSDALSHRTFVVDYSSPNVAKTLHAGHIRSTIIGHVLSNLYDACGALAYRVNHINDFGGFGFTLEGYRRFGDRFPVEMSANERLLEIYAIRRTGERVVEGQIPLESVTDAERELLRRYFPDVDSTAELAKQFQDYIAASDARFAALEDGVAEEVELWASMVQWSLAEFDKFYDALNIEFDLLIGESFYFEAGESLIEQCLNDGAALVYDAAAAEQDIRALDAKLAEGEISESDYQHSVKSINKDVGAVVVALDNGERYVVRRADGRSIYSTRDLGAIKLRIEIFEPTDIVYVVGQEQKVHFDRLFKTAYQIKLAEPERHQFKHLYFGFYVDAKTGKKLSSRDTVANVHHLLDESFLYFRSRLSERVDQSADEIDRAARELAVGSLVFNDLTQDVKGAVEIETADISATIAAFEKSGGAYVVYSACRARAILRKYGKKPMRANEIDDFEIDDQEAVLLLRLQQIPEKILASAEQSNPATLVRHLLDTATIYNSYYARAEVLSDGIANPSRLLITQATQQALINGLRLCHVECPEAI